MRLRAVYTLIGGDARQRFLAQKLAAAGFDVHTSGVPGLCDTDSSLHDALAGADAVVLPMPALREGAFVRAQTPIALHAVLESMRPGAVLLGGGLRAARPLLELSGVRWIDYGEDEALLVENAALSAEAAADLAMQHLPGTLAGADVLVIGYGRIGARLCAILRALGASVTAAARKPEDFARIRAAHLRPDVTRRYLHGLGGYDLIVNTVPAPVLTEEQLQLCKPGCVYLELASEPGGLAAAPPAHVHAADGRALPGRYAPEAAAAILYRTLLRLGPGGAR